MDDNTNATSHEPDPRDTSELALEVVASLLGISVADLGRPDFTQYMALLRFHDAIHDDVQTLAAAFPVERLAEVDEVQLRQRGAGAMLETGPHPSPLPTDLRLEVFRAVMLQLARADHPDVDNLVRAYVEGWGGDLAAERAGLGLARHRTALGRLWRLVTECDRVINAACRRDTEE